MELREISKIFLILVVLVGIDAQAVFELGGHAGGAIVKPTQFNSYLTSINHLEQTSEGIIGLDFLFAKGNGILGVGLRLDAGGPGNDTKTSASTIDYEISFLRVALIATARIVEESRFYFGTILGGGIYNSFDFRIKTASGTRYSADSINNFNAGINFGLKPIDDSKKGGFFGKIGLELGYQYFLAKDFKASNGSSGPFTEINYSGVYGLMHFLVCR